MKYSLCILTPLYNRKEFLPSVFDSLKAQSKKDFQWLVIDDGSLEKSNEAIEAFGRESGILCEYHYKENGGKHTALNYSHPYIKSDWILILDSDDSLTPDCVETVCKYIEKYGERKDIAVISFLKAYSNGKTTCVFDKEDTVSDTIQYRINAGRNGDCCEVVRADVLREFEFPVFEGENFLDEAHLWIGSAKKYKTVYINKPLYICEYQDGGLSDQGVALRRRNPLGGIHTQIVGLDKRCNIKYRVKKALLLIYFGKLAKKSIGELCKLSGHPIFVGLISPLGILFYRYREWKFNKS